MSNVVLHPAQVGSISLLERPEDLELSEILVVFARVVPAKHVEEQLKLVRVDRDSQHDINFLQYFEELSLDCLHTAVTAAHQPVEVVHRGVLSLTQTGREPLDHVKENLMVACEAHCEID